MTAIRTPLFVLVIRTLQFVTWGVFTNSAEGSVLQFVTWGVFTNSAEGSVLQFVTWGVFTNSAEGSVLQFVTPPPLFLWAVKLQ